MPSSRALTSSGEPAHDRVVLEQVRHRVSTEPRSLTATNSTSAPAACAARKKLRPMRPKPLMPTRTVMALVLCSSCRQPGHPSMRRSRLPVDRWVGRYPRSMSRCWTRGSIAPPPQPPGQLLGDDHRAVAAAGAADGDRQVALALGLVGRQQQVEQVVEARRGTRRSPAGRARSRAPAASSPVSGRSASTQCGLGRKRQSSTMSTSSGRPCL